MTFYLLRCNENLNYLLMIWNSIIKIFYPILFNLTFFFLIVEEKRRKNSFSSIQEGSKVIFYDPPINLFILVGGHGGHPTINGCIKSLSSLFYYKTNFCFFLLVGGKWARHPTISCRINSSFFIFNIYWQTSFCFVAAFTWTWAHMHRKIPGRYGPLVDGI